MHQGDEGHRDQPGEDLRGHVTSDDIRVQGFPKTCSAGCRAAQAVDSTPARQRLGERMSNERSWPIGKTWDSGTLTTTS